MGKNMALINNGIVDEINWYEDAEEGSDVLVSCADKPVDIGDSYADGKFYRNGEELLSELQSTLNELADADAALDIALGVS